MDLRNPGDSILARTWSANDVLFCTSIIRSQGLCVMGLTILRSIEMSLLLITKSSETFSGSSGSNTLAGSRYLGNMYASLGTNRDCLAKSICLCSDAKMLNNTAGCVSCCAWILLMVFIALCLDFIDTLSPVTLKFDRDTTPLSVSELCDDKGNLNSSMLFSSICAKHDARLSLMLGSCGRITSATSHACSLAASARNSSDGIKICVRLVEPLHASSQGTSSIDQQLISEFRVSDQLKNITFKKPALRLSKHTYEPKPPTNPLEAHILQSMPSKRAWTKPDLKVKRIKIDNSAVDLDSKALNVHEIPAAVEQDLPVVHIDSESLHEDARNTFVAVVTNPFVLDLETLTTLEIAMNRLWYSKLLRQMDSKLLITLADACVRSIDFQFVDNTDAELEAALVPSKCAILLLIVLTSAHTDRQLYLETYLTSVLEFVYSVTDALATESQHSETFIKHQIKILDLLARYAKWNNMEDSIATKLEYHTLKLCFDGASRSVFHDKLRVAASNVIYEIFNRNPDQRVFLLNEIVNSFDTLPANKSHARHYHLARGFSVQLVTMLLVRLVQSFTICYEFDDAYWKVSGKKRQDLNAAVYEFVDAADEELSRLCNQIASLLVTRVTTNYDATGKRVLENFIEDLLAMLEYPEYSGCETLLESFLYTLMFVFSSDNYSGPVEAFALELMGMIGSKILSLRGDYQPVRFGPEMTVAEFDSLVGQYLAVWHSLKIHGAFFAFKFFVKVHALAKTASKKLLARCQETEFSLLQLIYHKIPFPTVSASTDYRAVLASQNLFSHYDGFLNLIVNSLDHPKTKSRNRAIKNLSLLISCEPSLVTLPKIKQSLAVRLVEQYASVRDSIIELLSNNIAQHPELVADFYVSACDRIADPSMAVRKKAIALAKIMYQNSDSLDVHVTVCEKLLRRQDDEEDAVIDLAVSCLNELLFAPHGRLLDKLEVMVQLVAKSEKNWTYFERFFREKIVHNFSADPALEKSIATIVKTVLEYVTNEVHSDRERVQKMTGLLAVFVKCDGNLLSQDQLVSLQPYITDDSSTGSSLCYNILQIFHYTLPKTKLLKKSFINQCQTSLLARLTKFNAHELEEAMPCLWLLSVMKKDTEKLARACISSLTLLRPYLAKIRDHQYEPDPKVFRLLFLLGNLGRHSHLDSHSTLFAASKLGFKDTDTVSGFIIRHITMFCNNELDVGSQRVAIKNLLNVCITHPRYFMSERILGVMDSVFETNDLDLQDIVINTLSTFLELQDREALLKNGLDFKDSKTTKLNVKVFHGESAEYVNDGICSSLVQRYLHHVLKNCLIDESDHSLRAVTFLKLVVNLGFANPKLCIPTIVALESSQIPVVRSIALSMHEQLFEKYESLIETGYMEGLRLAFDYRSRLSPSLLEEKTLLRCLFSVLEGSKGAAKRFLKLLLKSLANFKTPNPLFVGYIAINLAAVNFKIQDHVLLLVSGLDSIIDNEGTEISDKMSEEDDWDSLAAPARAVLSLIRLKQVLITNYNVSDDKLANYQETSRDFKGPIARVDTVPLELQDLDLEQHKNSRYSFKLCNKLLQFIET
ncbi:hypothetical protein OGAPHI_002145 [Ogataea philodendri]|uniref:Sister chromatid cohesion protein n=2 Tax=Saccharomycotina TaxID=147537 RepID=A0A9P8T7W6_9ASCO|nr:uncharacterized protein OGAPHI_002145 [Ogataea philodendri]KAH3668391.1 hypothetical protein OGAPHI_002145 [Ogataea philodendri]